MSGQGLDDALEGADARDEAAHGDDRLAELERSHQRLQHLYDISRLLARFQTFKKTLPKVVDLIAHTPPLRNAIVVLDTGGSAQAITCQALGETPLRLRGAKTHAQATYRDLVRSNVDLEHEEVTTLEGLQLLPGPTESQTEAKNNFVMLPFAVSHSSVFGALQIEGVAEISLAADAIISVDEAQRIVMYNEGAQRSFGWLRDRGSGQAT